MANPDMSLTGDFALKAISDRIIKAVSMDLKERVMAIIGPEIDSACERAAMSLKPTIESYIGRNYATGIIEHVVKVTVEKRDH